MKILINFFLFIFFCNFLMSMENDQTSIVSKSEVDLNSEVVSQVAKDVVAQVPEETIIELAAMQSDQTFELLSTQEKVKVYFSKLSAAFSLRSFVKTVSYRIVGTIAGVALAYIFTTDVEKALSLGLLDLFTKTILYYVHERVWHCIQCGKLKEKILIKN